MFESCLAHFWIFENRSFVDRVPVVPIGRTLYVRIGRAVGNLVVVSCIRRGCRFESCLGYKVRNGLCGDEVHLYKKS